MGPRVKDLRGKKFGRITVLQYSHKNKFGCIYWNCLCECGTQKTLRGSSLKAGLIRSCGCFHREAAADQGRNNKRHGDTINYSPTVEWVCWRNIRRRCYNTKDKSYKDYGKRGIRVCARWLHSFENFLTDMGRKPSPKHSIERINNDGNYTPKNCCWELRVKQNNNRRDRQPLHY
jgi:hypothetical protein